MGPNSICIQCPADVRGLSSIPFPFVFFVFGIDSRARQWKLNSGRDIRGTADTHVRAEQRWKWTGKWVNKTCLAGRRPLSPFSGSSEPPGAGWSSLQSKRKHVEPTQTHRSGSRERLERKDTHENAHCFLPSSSLSIYALVYSITRVHHTRSFCPCDAAPELLRPIEPMLSRPRPLACNK